MAGMRYQPQGRARIDRGNPLTRGLRVVINAGSGYQNLVNDRQMAPIARNAATPLTVGAPLGLAWDQSGTNAGWTTATTPDEDLHLLDAATIMTLFVVTTTVGAPDPDSHYLFCNGGVPSYPGLGSMIRIPSYTNQRGLQSQWRQDAYTTTAHPSIQAVLSSGMVACAISTFQRNGACDLILNGKTISTVTGADQPLHLNTIGTGLQVCTSAKLGPAAMLLACSWDRKLAAHEVRALTENPWQLFADEADEDMPALEAVKRVLTVGAVALAIAAGAVRMTVARRLAAQPAGLTMAGGAVEMRAARRVTVSPAALVVAGGDVVARASRRLGVQPTILQLAGGDVGMRAGRRVGVAPAGLALNAGDVSLRAARRLAVAPAALALTGGPVDMLYAAKETPGSYTLPVAATAMALGGGEVRMRVSRRLVVTPARLDLVTGGVRALVGRRLLVSPAALAAGAGSVGMAAHRRLPVAAAGLALVPGEVTLRYSSQIEYARAPLGAGYAPQRVTVSARPAQTGGFRPPAIQETIR